MSFTISIPIANEISSSLAAPHSPWRCGPPGTGDTVKRIATGGRLWGQCSSDCRYSRECEVVGQLRQTGTHSADAGFSVGLHRANPVISVHCTCAVDSAAEFRFKLSSRSLLGILTCERIC